MNAPTVRSAILGFAIVTAATLAGCGEGTPPAQTPYEAANTIRGGQLYDNWWVTTGRAAGPTDSHPLWAARPDTMSNVTTGAGTWRCKECHGWDYRGVDGAYAMGSRRTGIRGIVAARTRTPQAIFDLLKNAPAAGTANHGYGAQLPDAELWNLTRFVRENTIDTTTYIGAMNRFQGGDMARGMALFLNGVGNNSSCRSCHGPMGTNDPPGETNFTDFVGKVANENPWEFLHKLRFGQPATPGMPTLFRAPEQEIRDLATYAQSLPTMR